MTLNLTSLGWEKKWEETVEFIFSIFYYHRHVLMGRPCCIVLCFTMIYIFLFFFLNKLKVCGGSMSSKSKVPFFQQHLHVFVSLCHILVLLTVRQSLHYYYIAIGDQWSSMFYYNRVVDPQTVPLCDRQINGHMPWLSWLPRLPYWRASPSLSPCPQASLFPETQQCGNWAHS